MANCPICGAPVASHENQVCENCRRSSYTAYTDAQGRPVFASDVPPQAQRQQAPGNSITRMLVAANIAVFLLMVVNGVPFTGPPETEAGAQQLVHWGAEYGPWVLAGQYWRMFSAMFLHDGVFHLLFNMWGLWQLGTLTERLMGRNSYLYLYLLAGIAGNILSIAINPMVLAVGASGAIFGLAGALIAILKFVRLNAPPEQVKSVWNNLVFIVVVNLFWGANSSQIDNMAHVGGLVCGFVIAFMLGASMNVSPERYRSAQAKVFPLITALLVMAFVAVRYWRLPGLVQHLHQ